MTTTDTQPQAAWPQGRVGYVGLLGRPNAGKSTLLNTILGQHLAAVSAQPQTTRRRFLGVYSAPGLQALFLDAPGVHRPAHELGQCMESAIDRVLAESDLILCLADPTRPPGAEDLLVAERAARAACPVFLVLNKVDRAGAADQARQEAFYRERLPQAPVFRLCALDRPSLEPLLAALREALPAGPFLHDPEAVTDAYTRDIGAELIREACLEQLRQEVPHAIAVTVDEWLDSGSPVRVQATLHVERDSQKRIVVGRGGAMIKAIRTAAEQKLAGLCDGPAALRLWVKVSPDWRQRRSLLRDFRLAE
ncbi:MAG: GTPase Era [Lentisphaerae bacterium]|nr:GTPase Era [Lentisphaerota bacterium]